VAATTSGVCSSPSAASSLAVGAQQGVDEELEVDGARRDVGVGRERLLDAGQD
jgi:hypothetical protein